MSLTLVCRRATQGGVVWLFSGRGLGWDLTIAVGAAVAFLSFFGFLRSFSL